MGTDLAATAISLNSSIINVARTVGPALAGVLILSLGSAPGSSSNGVVRIGHHRACRYEAVVDALDTLADVVTDFGRRDEHARATFDRDKYVASSNPAARLDWPNSTLLHGDVSAAVADLKESSGTNLVIMGSGVLIGSLMAAALIDEYLLMIHPLVLGTGRRLFAAGTEASLRLVDISTTSMGVLIATYEPARG